VTGIANVEASCIPFHFANMAPQAQMHPFALLLAAAAAAVVAARGPASSMTDLAIDALPPGSLCTAVANVNCPGNDIQPNKTDHPKTESAAACCTVCQDTPGCTAWTVRI